MHLSRGLLSAALLWMSACVGHLQGTESDEDESGASVPPQDADTLGESADEPAAPPSDSYDPEPSAEPADEPADDPPRPSAPPTRDDDIVPAAPVPTTPPPVDTDDDPPIAAPPARANCGDATETEELNLTNSARASEGRAALACDALLTQVARAHSQDMCNKRYFSHTDLEGGSFATRIRDAGGSFRSGGENIAAGQPTSSSVHQAWMNSSGHRANILNGGYRRIGIGYAPCGGRPYWTQVFTD